MTVTVLHDLAGTWINIDRVEIGFPRLPNESRSAAKNVTVAIQSAGSSVFAKAQSTSSASLDSGQNCPREKTSFFVIAWPPFTAMTSYSYAHVIVLFELATGKDT